MVFDFFHPKPNTMKTNLLFIIAITLLLSSCYTTQNYSLSPHEPVYSFWEDGKQYAYSELDSVIVSIGFDAYYNNEFILDLAIDNRSDSAFFFNPSEIYVFRYNSNSTLVDKMAYHPSEPHGVIDSLIANKERQEKKIKRNTVFGIILGVAIVTAAVAIAASGDAEPETAEALIDSQIETQSIINETHYEAKSSIDEIEWQQDYWKNGVMHETTIEADSIKFGKIHLRIPYSPRYVVYIPVNNRVCRFAFKTESR